MSCSSCSALHGVNPIFFFLNENSRISHILTEKGSYLSKANHLLRRKSNTYNSTLMKKTKPYISINSVILIFDGNNERDFENLDVTNSRYRT